MILCDVGNSCFHFFYDGKIWRENINAITKKSKEYTIYYISVNPRNEKKLLESHKNCQNIANLVEIDSVYQGLGIDRKVACLSVSNGVIVDAGSAITIDVMQENIHLGGCILPGIEGYRNLFSTIDTLNVDFNLHLNLDLLPQNTKDAVSYGCLKSIILSIENLAKDNNIYFTGGDGKFLSRFFKHSFYDDTLIFRGMIKVINKNKLKV